MDGADTCTLGDDLLSEVFAWLTPSELARISNASRRFKNISYRQELWQSHCERKWTQHNKALWPKGDWRSLYVNGNGFWPSGPHFQQYVVLGRGGPSAAHGVSSPGHTMQALASAAATLQLPPSAGGGMQSHGHAIVISFGSELQLLGLPCQHGAGSAADQLKDEDEGHAHTASGARRVSGAIPCGRVSLDSGTTTTCCTALAWVPGTSCLLAGTSAGMLYSVPAAAFSQPASAAIASSQPARLQPQLFSQPNGMPISDIVFLGAGAQIPAQPQLPQLKFGTAQFGRDVGVGGGPTQDDGDSGGSSESGSLHSAPSQIMAAVLHDVFLGQPVHPLPPQTRSHVRLYDVGAQKHVCDIRDMMDEWGLVALTTLQGTSCTEGFNKANPRDGVDGVREQWKDAGCGSQALALSMSQPVCRQCWEANSAWLCSHMQWPQGRSAALCVLDTRLDGLLAARFDLNHRTVAPRLCVTRGTFALTSHAGQPLAVWDLRKMYMPLAKCRWLDHSNLGPLDPPPAAWQFVDAFGAPTPRPAYHTQALWLSCNDDVIVGRADNGCVWAWDLAAVLGWANGSMPGAWGLADEVGGPLPEEPDEGWEVELRQIVRGARPMCLGGAPPPSSSYPYISLLADSDPLSLLMLEAGGSDACLIGRQGQAGVQQEGGDAGDVLTCARMACARDGAQGAT